MRQRVVGRGVGNVLAVLAVCCAAAAGQEPPVTPPDTSSPQVEQSGATNVNLTGTVVDQDGAPWEGLQVVLVPWDAAKKEGSIFFYPDDKGMTQLGNPHATTDIAGRFTITVSRAYLENEGTRVPHRVHGGRLRIRGVEGAVGESHSPSGTDRAQGRQGRERRRDDRRG